MLAPRSTANISLTKQTDFHDRKHRALRREREWVRARERERGREKGAEIWGVNEPLLSVSSLAPPDVDGHTSNEREAEDSKEGWMDGEEGEGVSDCWTLGFVQCRVAQRTDPLSTFPRAGWCTQDVSRDRNATQWKCKTFDGTNGAKRRITQLTQEKVHFFHPFTSLVTETPNVVLSLRMKHYWATQRSTSTGIITDKQLIQSRVNESYILN